MTRVLILDDEPEIGRLVGDTAVGLGFETDITTTRAAFVDMLALRAPGLIVLDLSFPDGDGIEVLRFLEANHYKGALILMSGTDPRVLTTAHRLGTALGLDVIGTACKPFQPHVVHELLALFASRDPVFTAADFRAALANSEIVMHYQPVVDMKSSRVLSVEALVRWARPNRDLTMPDDFLPSVARLGLMHELTLAVIDATLTEASRWKHDGIDLGVAINVPAGVVLSPAFFGELAEARLRIAPPVERIAIELTETEAMGDPVGMMEVLSRLRLSGVELAIDDFGTGYSSLVELRRLPFNRLKIDKSFVLACVREDDAAAITRAVIELSHTLGISVIAEGVETKQIWDRLVEWGCDAAQGYYVGRPMPGAAIPAWIADWNGRSTG